MATGSRADAAAAYLQRESARKERRRAGGFAAYERELREECGVFGVIGTGDAAALTALGLHALQHRGQEGAGIACYDPANDVFQNARPFAMRH